MIVYIYIYIYMYIYIMWYIYIGRGCILFKNVCLSLWIDSMREAFRKASHIACVKRTLESAHGAGTLRSSARHSCKSLVSTLLSSPCCHHPSSSPGLITLCPNVFISLSVYIYIYVNIYKYIYIYIYSYSYPNIENDCIYIYIYVYIYI